MVLWLSFLVWELEIGETEVWVEGKKEDMEEILEVWQALAEGLGRAKMSIGVLLLSLFMSRPQS